MVSISIRVGTILGPKEVSITQISTVQDIIVDICQKLDIPYEYAPAFALLKRTAIFSVECMDRLLRPYFSILHGSVSIFFRIAIFPSLDIIKHLNQNFRIYLLKQVQRAIITRVWQVPNDYSLLLSAFYYIVVSGGIPDLQKSQIYQKYIKSDAGEFICSDILVRYSDKTLDKMFRQMFSSMIKQNLATTPDDALQHYFNIIGTSVKQYGYACFSSSVRQFDKAAPESDAILLLNNKGIVFLNTDLSENTGYTYDALKGLYSSGSQITLTVMISDEPKEMILELDHVAEVLSFIKFFSNCVTPSPYLRVSLALGV